MPLTDSLLPALARSIARSGLSPAILGSEHLAGGRCVQQLSGVLVPAFEDLGLRVSREAPNPWVRRWRQAHSSYPMGWQRADYLLTRKGVPVGLVELESLDRAQVYTFKCQYTDRDNGKRDYYYATVDQLVAEPGLPRPDFFLFFLLLPDFPVKPYVIWDRCDPYYGVSASDRRTIFKSPYRFYDRRIKALLRGMLLNRDPEATPGDDWSVRGTRLAELQDVCELVVITLTGSELILSRGRDLLERSKERRRPVRWASPPATKPPGRRSRSSQA